MLLWVCRMPRSGDSGFPRAGAGKDGTSSLRSEEARLPGGSAAVRNHFAPGPHLHSCTGTLPAPTPLVGKPGPGLIRQGAAYPGVHLP